MRLAAFSLFVMGACGLTASSAPQPETSAKEREGVTSAKDAKGATKSAPVSKSAPKGRNVALRMAEGLRFDPPRFEAKPKELLQLQLENIDPSHLAHNLVVVKPGMIQEVVQVAMAMGEAAVAKAFVPEHPGVLAATSKLVDPDKKLAVSFTVPEEPGVYGYVCTVPGHGMIMYGAIYVGTPMPPLAKDTNIPQLNLEKGLVGAGKRPFVQRMFVPNAGPAAISVALPGTQNFCFDAVSCSVRFAWAGAFLDAGAHWRGNGAAMAELGDVPWWTGETSPLRFNGEKVASGKARFLGYTLQEGIPEFHYRVDKQEIFQRVTAEGKGLQIAFRLPGNVRKVGVGIGTGNVSVSGSAGELKDGVWEVSGDKAAEFWVRIESKAGSSGGGVHGHSANPPAAPSSAKP